MEKLKDIPLAARECRACREAVCPLESHISDGLMGAISDEWSNVEGRLERVFKFKNFRGALDMTNRIGELAEEQGHHPDIFLAWGRVKVILYTHKVKGLTEADFVMAAKIDKL